MKNKTLKEIHTTYKVDKQFDVKVEWLIGDTTIETVIADDGKFLYFKFNKNKSIYAPHSFCTKYIPM